MSFFHLLGKVLALEIEFTDHNGLQLLAGIAEWVFFLSYALFLKRGK